MLITTANYLPDLKFIKTFDPITVNLVLGTNALSDFNASLSDFFGGRSGSYEKRLNSLFNEAKSNLIEQVKRLGGNAIIGFTVSYNELSGKDKSMLMISIYGTPILLNDSFNNNEISESINFETFENKLKATRVLKYYSDKEIKAVGDRDLKFILNSTLRDFENFVYKLINIDNLQLANDGVNAAINKKDFLQYYKGFSDNEKSEMLFSALDKSFQKKNVANLFLNFIKVEKAINLDLILDKVKHLDLDNALWYYELAIESKETYSKDDISKLEDIKVNFLKIKSDFELILTTEKGMFGSSEKWICPKCEAKNSTDKSICANCKYQTIKFPTFNKGVEEFINELQIRIDVLKSIFLTINEKM